VIRDYQTTFTYHWKIFAERKSSQGITGIIHFHYLVKIRDNPINSGNIILSKLNPQCFWDVDLSASNDASCGRLIIERVFSLADLQEMNQVINYYGKEKVVEIL
jgi:hypothetical protein